MALTAKIKDTEFGVGDRIAVYMRVAEGDKVRLQVYEGIVISIRGRMENKSFVVRRIGSAKVGIERIFPLASPLIEKVIIKKKGLHGVKSAKLYYIREKSPKQIQRIYDRVKGKVKHE